jgi:23S rRNA (uracil1939-C5)-methyltransferase
MPVETVQRIGARGDGVTGNGRFVAMSAPGDLVAADGAITPGPHHQTPLCRHFPECGGCQLQHVDDAAYADFLKDRIAHALAAQGLPAPDILEPHLSPPKSRRRAALKAAGGLLGFNAGQTHRIVDMRECHILRPELFALVAPLRRLLNGRAEVTMTLADQGVDLLLGGVTVGGLAEAEAMTGFARDNGLARLALDDGYGAQILWEPEPVTITLSGISVALPSGAFLQATAEGEAALVAAMREAVGEAGIVADLFAGLGTFALALSGKVYAAEGARDAVLALKSAGRGIFADHRDLFRRPLDVAELNRFEAVVLDPPRAGAKEQTPLLACSSVPRIAYISCNPNTFARDAKILVDGGYRLSWVKPVGQFRWSTHVELAAAFVRA